MKANKAKKIVNQYANAYKQSSDIEIDICKVIQRVMLAKLCAITPCKKKDITIRQLTMLEAIISTEFDRVLFKMSIGFNNPSKLKKNKQKVLIKTLERVEQLDIRLEKKGKEISYRIKQ